MSKISQLINNNSQWSKKQIAKNPEFFRKMSEGQSPDYLWIGCSDSRVVPNDILGLGAGEVFVHRNIANTVKENDLNSMAVIQYAVQVLKVKHIIVCGHTGCGGVSGAVTGGTSGPVSEWLKDLSSLAEDHSEELHSIKNHYDKCNTLSIINVKQQVKKVSELDIVKEAKSGKQPLNIHGMMFYLNNGLLEEIITL